MLPVISLIVLVAVIAVSVITKKNCGIIAVIAAYGLGVFGAGMKAKEITAGWPTTVLFIIIATTFLFGIANINGTTKALSANIAHLAHGNNKIMPLLFFVIGAIISGAGAGGLIVAVIMPIALIVAVENKIPVIMMSIVTMGGIMVGGLSPLAINGIVAKSLAAEQGLENYLPMYLAYAVSMSVFSLAAYFIFGGLKLAPSDTSGSSFVAFDRKQTMTLVGIAAVIVGVVFFGQDIGLLSFSVAGILLLLNAADQKKAISSMPWATILLIAGMSILIKVVSAVGGIDYLSGALSNIMTATTAQPIMIVLGGLMGAVSSGTGVVMPTLIPLASEMAAQMSGTSALTLIIGVIVGTNGVVISPLSTVGGIAVACAPEGVDKDKLYNQLLIAAIAFTLLCTIAAFIGFYGIFA